MLPTGRLSGTRGRRILQALLVGAVAVLIGGISGCRTVDGGALETGGIAGGLHPDDDAFLRRVAEEALPGRVDDAQATVFFSFERWESGRTVALTLVPDLSGGVDRIDRGIVFLNGSQRIAIVETSVSRLTASIGLNAAGWQRDGWGVWRSPDKRTAVHLESNRTWRVFNGVTADNIRPLGGQGEVVRSLRTPEWGASAVDNVACVGIVRFPDLEGVPEEFQPLTMKFTVSNESEVEARFVFPDPRSARVALVPFRLRGERTLGAYGFTPTEGFDIQRNGGEISVTGVVVEALIFPADGAPVEN